MKACETAGGPPPVYSVDVDIWLMRALREVLLHHDLKLACVMTTDYAMHRYGPDETESKRHMQGIDQGLAEAVAQLEACGEEVLICVTADHGMSRKRKAVNLQLILERHGVACRMNTIIADRYVAHHMNLGGAVYVYPDNPDDAGRCLEVLQETEGVDQALARSEASTRYHLDASRIGDLFVLAEQDYVFGLVDDEVMEVSLRSHGSLHESQVPMVVNRPVSRLAERLENKDVTRLALGWLRGSPSLQWE